ncbi:hypothetical protein RB200_07325 [Streptomyces sp. PmtG]
MSEQTQKPESSVIVPDVCQSAVASPTFFTCTGFTHNRTSVLSTALPTVSDVRWAEQVQSDSISALIDWGLRSADVLDAASLVLSELVTYMLRYGEGPVIDVQLAYFANSVRFAVRSGSLGGVRPHEPGASATHRWVFPLPLVGAIATDLRVVDDWLTCSLELSTARERA